MLSSSFDYCTSLVSPAMPTVEHAARDIDSRAALPESVRHVVLLQEEIAKMSDRSEDQKLQEECSGGSLARWQGPYWWKSLKIGKPAQPLQPVPRR